MDLLSLSKNVAAQVESQATKAKVPVAVSVVDVHGNVVLQHRMPGAPLFSLELSERKAYTSALVRLRTADLVPLVRRPALRWTRPRRCGCGRRWRSAAVSTRSASCVDRCRSRPWRAH